MKNKMELQIGWLLALILLAVMGLSINVPVHADSLYIGDGGDNSVKRFNAET